MNVMNSTEDRHPIGTWDSALSETTGTDIRIRGYDIVDLIDNMSFAGTLHLLHTGELPTTTAERLLDAVMVASIDHGPGTPSALTARTAVSGSGSLIAGAAAGMLAMGRYHGATVGDSMEVIGAVVERAGGADPASAASTVVEEVRAAGRRVGGFGHRQHTRMDPRSTRLISLAEELGVEGHHIAAGRAVETALEETTGRPLPMNIDGATAVVLGEISFPAELADLVFVTSRMAGVLRHAAEELQTMPPMRRIDPTGHRYTGPPARDFPDRGEQ